MSDAGSFLDRLDARERRLLGVLGLVAAVFVAVLVPWGLATALSARRAEVDAYARAIDAIKSSREAIRARQARRDAVLARYAQKVPSVGALIERAAKEQKLEVTDSQDRADVPHGKRYNERSTVVHLRKAAMLPLAKTLESLEQQRMPVVVSRLDIRRRPGEHDSYDVELGVSAYDRAEPSKDAAKGATAPDGGAP